MSSIIDWYDVNGSGDWNSGYSLGSTVGPELPRSEPGDIYGTTAQPSVATNNTGGFLSGLLGGIETTADSLLNTWSRVNSISTNAENLKFNQQINAAKLDLAKAQIGGQIDVAKTKAMTDAQIEQIRAQTAVSVAQRQADNAKYGYVPATTGNKLIDWGLIIAAASFAYTVFKKGRA